MPNSGPPRQARQGRECAAYHASSPIRRAVDRLSADEVRATIDRRFTQARSHSPSLLSLGAQRERLPPRAMMMKAAQRSAMLPPSTYQSSTADAPYLGIQNRAIGPAYSMTSATAQSTSRRSTFCAIPPHTQNTADTPSQM